MPRCSSCGSEEHIAYVECRDGVTEPFCCDCIDSDEPNESTHCEYCQCITSIMDTRDAIIDGFNRLICDTCYYDHFCTCDGCGHIFEQGNVTYHYRTDSHMCEDCISENSYPEDAINSWDYRPTFRIFNDAQNLKRHEATFGIEVEMEYAEDEYEAIEYFSNSDLFYLKQDGSINNGFEAVSHPFTFRWMKNNGDEFQPIFDASNVMRAFSAKNCGMHIHVGRRAFSGPTHLYKFAKMLMHYREFTVMLSRRPEGNLSQWAEPCDWQLVNRCKRGRGGDRYLAVNLNNNSTVEVRIFQSTATRVGLFGNIECVDGLIQFTRNVSMNDATPANYLDYMLNHKKQYNNFNTMFRHYNNPELAG